MVFGTGIEFSLGAGKQYSAVRPVQKDPQAPTKKGEGPTGDLIASLTSGDPAPTETPNALQAPTGSELSFDFTDLTNRDPSSYSAATVVYELAESLGKIARNLVLGAISFLVGSAVSSARTTDQFRAFTETSYRQTYADTFSHNSAMARAADFLSGSLVGLLSQWKEPGKITQIQTEVRNGVWTQNQMKYANLVHEEALHEVMG